ncbi:MAG: ElyC/SanA/YdcF family protein [bacterium]|nr:ElyC/SanA/YdcF family protein [bacterium]
MIGKYFKWRWLLYILFFGFWSLWLVQQRVENYSRYIVDDCLADIRGSRPAALVLGAGVKDTVSPVYADRLETAAELYQKGLVEKIIVSGDHGKAYYDEVNAGKDYMLAKNIPAEDIFLDHAGFRTYDSIYRARDIFGVDNFLIVTQDFHLPRALYIANRLNVTAWGCRADKRYYLNSSYMQRREYLASIKAWLDVNIKVRPRFLGEQIDITGDGRVTWDE